MRIAGHLPELEEQAVAWQQGQHCPDSVAALVVGHDVLVHAMSRRGALAAPVGRLVDPHMVSRYMAIGPNGVAGIP